MCGIFGARHHAADTNAQSVGWNNVGLNDAPFSVDTDVVTERWQLSVAHIRHARTHCIGHHLAGSAICLRLVFLPSRFG